MQAIYILTVVTFLRGSAWGPTVSFVEKSSHEECEKHKKVLLETVKEITDENTNPGGFRPASIKVRCDKK